MSVSASQIAQLRRMVAEPTTTTYSDAALSLYIAKYPTVDERGQPPYEWDTATRPPTQEVNDDWIETYDLAAAASDVWGEKAGTLAQDFDTNADGASLSRSQAYTQAAQQARYWFSRRRPGTVTLHVWPEKETNETWIINAPKVD
jgi:hypothetical protein